MTDLLHNMFPHEHRPPGDGSITRELVVIDIDQNTKTTDGWQEELQGSQARIEKLLLERIEPLLCDVARSQQVILGEFAKRFTSSMAELPEYDFQGVADYLNAPRSPRAFTLDRKTRDKDGAEHNGVCPSSSHENGSGVGQPSPHSLDGGTSMAVLDPRQGDRVQMHNSQSHGRSHSERAELPIHAAPSVQSMVPPTLPSDWPRTLALRKQPRRKREATPAGVAPSPAAGRSRMSRSGSLGHVDETLSQSLSALGSVYPWYIINPNKRWHLMWDLSSLCILTFDIVVMPFVLAWDVPMTGPLAYIALFAVCFWTVDMFMMFVTAYVGKGGKIVYAPHRLAKHYVQTWFVLDCSMVVSDWVSIYLFFFDREQDGVELLRLFRLSKIGRGLRAVGMLRLVRALQKVEQQVETMSDTALLAVQVFRMLAGVLLAAHIISCAWYAISVWIPSDTGLRWVDLTLQVGDGYLIFLDSSYLFQYVVAFNWTIAQLTLGASYVEAASSLEVIFTVFCVLLGLLIGTTLISSLSAAMVDSSMSHRETNEKRRALRKFLRQNVRKNQNLVKCVLRQFNEHLVERHRLTEDKVAALEVISHNLKTEIRLESLKPHLFSMALYRCWDRLDSNALRITCMDSMMLSFSHTGEDLFYAGTVAECCYFIVNGTLNYTQRPDTSPVSARIVVPVPEGSWLSEASLWAHWIHVGIANVSEMTEILTIRANSLWASLQGGVMLDLLIEYSISYHRRLVSSLPPHSPWPTDLSVPFTSFPEIVLTLPTELQRIISDDAFQQLGARHFFTVPTEKLRAEVSAGKSVVLVDDAGEVRRVVAIVAVQVINHEDKVLCQIGSWDVEDNTLKAKCQFPGAKQENGELLVDTLHRVLNLRLWALGSGLELIGSERQIFVEHSKGYGLPTRYIKTVVRMNTPPDGGDQDLFSMTLASAQTSGRSYMSSMRGTATSQKSSVTKFSKMQPPGFRRRNHLPGSRTSIGSLSAALGHDFQTRMMFRPVHPVREKGTDVVNLMTWVTWEEYDWLVQEEDFLHVWMRGLRPQLIKTKDVWHLNGPGRRQSSSGVSNGSDENSDAYSLVGDNPANLRTFSGSREFQTFASDSGSGSPIASATVNLSASGQPTAVSRIPQSISEENSLTGLESPTVDSVDCDALIVPSPAHAEAEQQSGEQPDPRYVSFWM